mgnify:CR=1 FL=1
MSLLNRRNHQAETPPVEALAQAHLSEIALAVCINGVSQSVMMVSDRDLEDFALGFALSEGLIESVNEVLDIVIKELPNGKQVDLHVLARTQHRLKLRRRTMAGPSGCGLCGLDSVSDAMALPIAQHSSVQAMIDFPDDSVILQARESLPQLQQAYSGMRGNHCAAYFDLSGNVIGYREDVGRHSALDKLIGHLAQEHEKTVAGFVMLTSRCSHDLVAKAARSNLPILITLAQPTSLAVDSARNTGVILFCFQQRQLKRFS